MEDRRDALRGVRADARAAAEVLRAMLPADGSLGGGRGDGARRDVLDLPRVVGHATCGSAGAAGGDPARRRDQRRVPPQARRGRRRTTSRIGMAVEAVWRPLEERTGLDPGHRVLPAVEVMRSGTHRSRRVAGRVPLHAGCGEHRVLRGAARSRRAARVAMRGVRRARTSRRGSSASGASRSSPPTPSAARAGRSSRSRPVTSASTASRSTNRSRSASSSSTVPTPS